VFHSRNRYTEHLNEKMLRPSASLPAGDGRAPNPKPPNHPVPDLPQPPPAAQAAAAERLFPVRWKRGCGVLSFWRRCSSGTDGSGSGAGPRAAHRWAASWHCRCRLAARRSGVRRRSPGPDPGPLGPIWVLAGRPGASVLLLADG
jgi:hypothetical protein